MGQTFKTSVAILLFACLSLASLSSLVGKDIAPDNMKTQESFVVELEDAEADLENPILKITEFNHALIEETIVPSYFKSQSYFLVYSILFSRFSFVYGKRGPPLA